MEPLIEVYETGSISLVMMWYDAYVGQLEYEALALRYYGGSNYDSLALADQLQRDWSIVSHETDLPEPKRLHEVIISLKHPRTLGTVTNHEIDVAYVNYKYDLWLFRFNYAMIVGDDCIDLKHLYESLMKRFPNEHEYIRDRYLELFSLNESK